MTREFIELISAFFGAGDDPHFGDDTHASDEDDHAEEPDDGQDDW